jgi:hypothetical protein
MRQLFAGRWNSLHFLDENIAMTILVSHGANVPFRFLEAILKMLRFCLMVPTMRTTIIH